MDKRGVHEVASPFWNLSSGTESADGSWASGTTPDGKGSFQYLEAPEPLSEAPVLPPADPRLHGTPPMPAPPVAG